MQHHLAYIDYLLPFVSQLQPPPWLQVIAAASPKPKMAWFGIQYTEGYEYSLQLVARRWFLHRGWNCWINQPRGYRTQLNHAAVNKRFKFPKIILSDNTKGVEYLLCKCPICLQTCLNWIRPLLKRVVSRWVQINLVDMRQTDNTNGSFMFMIILTRFPAGIRSKIMQRKWRLPFWLSVSLLITTIHTLISSYCTNPRHIVHWGPQGPSRG